VLVEPSKMFVMTRCHYMSNFPLEFAKVEPVFPLVKQNSERKIDGQVQTRFDPAMCNLYSITRSQEAIRRLFRVGRDLTGNMPPLPGVFPDTMAPVVRVASDGERELSLMRRRTSAASQ
jgi:hypothetical protein